MEVGAYSMHLYCDAYRPDGDDGYPNASDPPPDACYHTLTPYEVVEQTRGECVKHARGIGWIFHRDNRLTCPECNKARATTPND